MATIQSLLDDINLRYRNTFTDAQKLVWMNDEQNDIFNTFKIDIGPVNFALQKGVQFYPLPVIVEYIEQIRTVTIQVGANQTYPEFMELPYRRDDDGVLADCDLWYTLVGQDTIFINIPPTATVDDYQVYMYIDGAAFQITSVTSPVSVPQKYQEILKLGTLKRIAAARKDVLMYNNYDIQRNEIIMDMTWTSVINEPSWISPVSAAFTVPKWGFGYYGYGYPLTSLSAGAGNGPTEDNTWNAVAYNPWNTLSNKE